MFPFYLWSESFRVNKVTVTQVEQTLGYETSVEMGINDALSVSLPEDRTFIEGLELKMEIPENIAYWVDSVACSVYSDIKPNPSVKQIDYSGPRVFVQTLPGKLSWVLQIPITKDNSLKVNKYITKVDTIIEPKNNSVFIRFQPVMKGIPEETLKSIIPITIKPLLIDKGQLNIELTPPQSQENLSLCTIYVDEKPVDKTKKIILDTGIHNISVISEDYRNENRTVRIDQAKTTDLKIEMKSIEPTLLITAPEGTLILFDEQECNQIEIGRASCRERV